MKKWYSLLLFVVCLACKKEDKKPNQPPKNFTVSVSNVTIASAQLNWTVANDPENGAVTYSVQLNGQQATSGVSTTAYKLEGLTDGTTYTGKVIAADSEGATTEASFNFSTNNSPSPSAFVVSMTKASYNTMELTWTASTLPNNAAVSYSVFLNDVLRVGGITTLNYLITGLQPQTQYNVKVVATSTAGKSTNATLQASTVLNQPPGNFTITKAEDGVTKITLEGIIPADPENETLTYFSIVDGVEKQIYPTIINSGTGFRFTADGLTSGQPHSFIVKVKDPAGAATSSNNLTIATYKAPENNFDINPVAEGDKVAIEFITATQEKINTSTSLYLVNNTWKSFANAQISYTTLPDQTTKIKIVLTDADLKTIFNLKFQLNLWWTPESMATYSKEVFYTHYTPTTAAVSSVTIKGPGQFPPQWTLNFLNCKISEYSSWTTPILMFDNIEISNFLGFAICNPSEIGYYTGNVTNSQYEYLKTKNTGYIIIKDAGGYHKLNFTYTTQD